MRIFRRYPYNVKKTMSAIELQFMKKLAEANELQTLVINI